MELPRCVMHLGMSSSVCTRGKSCTGSSRTHGIDLDCVPRQRHSPAESQIWRLSGPIRIPTFGFQAGKCWTTEQLYTSDLTVDVSHSFVCRWSVHLHLLGINRYSWPYGTGLMSLAPLIEVLGFKSGAKK